MYIARLFKMSWNKRLRRWEKMHKGRRLWVACSTLHGLYGPLPEDRWTKEGSYHLANRWLDDTLGHRVATELDRQIAWADANDPDLAKQLRQRQRNDLGADDGDMNLTLAILREQGMVIPPDFDTAILRDLFGNGL